LPPGETPKTAVRGGRRKTTTVAWPILPVAGSKATCMRTIDPEYTGRAGLHAFRHSLATVLIVEENVDPKTAQGILRHTDAGLTMNIYKYAQDPAKRAALEKFESRLLN
jgi:integrase